MYNPVMGNTRRKRTGTTGAWRGRIVLDPRILAGKPIVRGTRISVEFVIERLACGWTVEDVLTHYPHLTAADIRACLAYAHEILSGERVYPLPV